MKTPALPAGRDGGTEETAVHHGGDLAAAARRFGAPAAGWLDLSTGINPWPYPAASDSALLHRLPDSEQLDRLRAAAAAAYGVGAANSVAVAPGTQALIQWLPRLRPACRVAILSPTYGEHAQAWRLAGHAVTEVAALPDAADADVVVLTRPNNPDGACAGRDEILSLADTLARRGGEVVVDEAFADTDADASLAATGAPGLLALRSFGKFYGLPGLRLGFALAPETRAREIADALGPWPVSTAAADLGARALADEAWRTAMRARLVAAAEALDGTLSAAGLEVIGGTPLYRLAACADAAAVYDRLGRAGIYVRHFPGNERWLRFGLPDSDAALARLADALGGGAGP